MIHAGAIGPKSQHEGRDGRDRRAAVTGILGGCASVSDGAERYLTLTYGVLRRL